MLPWCSTLPIVALNDQHRDGLSEKGLQFCQRRLALIGGHSRIWNLHFLCHFMIFLFLGSLRVRDGRWWGEEASVGFCHWFSRIRWSSKPLRRYWPGLHHGTVPSHWIALEADVGRRGISIFCYSNLSEFLRCTGRGRCKLVKTKLRYEAWGTTATCFGRWIMSVWEQDSWKYEKFSKVGFYPGCGEI